MGWLAILAGIGWLATALGLWGLQPWARTVAMIIAGISLFEAVLAFFQFPGSGVGFAMAIMPAVILWYLSTADVKRAFGDEVSQKADAVRASGIPDRRSDRGDGAETGLEPATSCLGSRHSAN